MVVVIAITTQLLKLKRAQPVCPWLAVLLRLLFSPATLLVNQLTSIITTIMAGYLYQMAPDLACSLGRNKATNWTLSAALCAIFFGPKCTEQGHWLDTGPHLSAGGGVICIFLKLAISKSLNVRAHQFFILFYFLKNGGFHSISWKETNLSVQWL